MTAPSRSRRSSAAVSSASALSRPRPVPGIVVTASDATRAMMSMTGVVAERLKRCIERQSGADQKRQLTQKNRNVAGSR
jgi:hypothetical protein